MKHTLATRLKISKTKQVKNPSYWAIHKWLVKWFGKADYCEICGDKSNRRYEWALIEEKHRRSKKAYMKMCVPCHRAFDGTAPDVNRRWHNVMEYA